MFRFVLCAMLSYVAAAPLTTRISLDLTATEWTHLMTYVWWLGAWAVWFFICLCVTLVWALFSVITDDL